MNARTRAHPAPAGAPIGLLRGYRPLDGAADEMLAGDGSFRPGWERLIATLDAGGPEGRSARFARADQHLADAGVYYRVYGGAGAVEREWPLAHLPLLVREAEWTQVAAGLTQRAELLEKIAADIYGANEFAEAGLIPAELIARSPEFLRPVAGARPPSGHFLHFLAFDLAREPDGNWRVLGDRTQAPSGAGFALENRVATTRALPDIFAELNVHRLAGFFRRFRDALQDQAKDGRRVAVLTPGILNDTYFEHAWIARYLGVMLLQGDDLRVSGGRVMVRTVSGLKPVSVLWRRMDASFADPLELRPDSQIGTPGLAEAVRQGSISLVNALGSGILETRALAAYLPGLARALTGRDLMIPGPRTWWCGDEAGRRHVLANIERLTIGPALSTRVAADDPSEAFRGPLLDGEARAALCARIERNGAAFAAQETVALSTMPVFGDAGLEPRPVILRAFAARTPEGWAVMPGGFARIGSAPGASAVGMQQGGRTADVWIISDGPVAQETLLTGAQPQPRIYEPGNLPSRAAENLFWLGRYAERTESLVRILRAWHGRIAEGASPQAPLLRTAGDYLDRLGVDVEQAVSAGLVRCIDNAAGSASQIRDRFSPDGWLALNDLSKTLHRFAGTVAAGDDAARAMTVILRKLAGFSGLVHENMYRFTGWRFLETGRRIERAIHMSRILAHLARDDAPEGALDLLLEIGDSVLTYRRQYGVSTDRMNVVRLLALDALNPRSVLFQVTEIGEQIAQLPNSAMPAEAAERLRSKVLAMQPDEATPDALGRLVAEASAVSDALSKTYFS